MSYKITIKTKAASMGLEGIISQLFEDKPEILPCGGLTCIILGNKKAWINTEQVMTIAIEEVIPDK